MIKAELAKDLTIAALNNKYIPSSSDSRTNNSAINKGIAENVAAFYNKLMEELNVTE